MNNIKAFVVYWSRFDPPSESADDYSYYSGEMHKKELEKKLNDAKLRVRIGHPSQFVVLGPIGMAKDRQWLMDQIKTYKQEG